MMNVFASSAGQCRSVPVSTGQCRSGPVSAGQCRSVPDLPLCLGVFKYRTTVGQGEGATTCQNKLFTVEFWLCGAILNLKVFCFGAIADKMRELIVRAQVRGLIT